MSVVASSSDDLELDALETTTIGDDVDLRDVPIAEDGLRGTVGEGDTRSVETVGEAVDTWNEYLSAKENSVIPLGGETEEGDTATLVLPHTHRWSSSYRRKTYARLKMAEEACAKMWGDSVPSTMLTLTAPHKDSQGNYRPFADVLEDIKDGWDKARRVIRRETEGIHTEYIAVFEPHATGYPHLHVAVFGTARPSLGSKISEYWTERYVDGASKEAQSCEVSRANGRDIDSPAGYLMKYMSKSLARSGQTDMEKQEHPSVSGYEGFSAMMWLTNKRTWSMSGSLRDAVSHLEEEYTDEDEDEEDESVIEDWELLPTASGIDPGLYIGKEAVRIQKYVMGSPNQKGNPEPVEKRPVSGDVRGGHRRRRGRRPE